MNANREQSHLIATAERPLTVSPFSNANGMRRVPGSRRERLRSFARATSQVIKQEINKYYYADDTQSSDPASRGIQSSATETMNRPGIPRQRTQSMNDLTQSSPVEAVQPYCMLFPTYACQVKDEHQELKWKIRLAGWTYAKPGSSRIERWILAAGRTYGGLSANSAEDVHFARLLNQFRCQTMRGIDVHLYVAGLIPAELALASSRSTDDDDDKKHHPLGIHHLRDLAHDAIKTTLVNSGPTGRFENLLMLDPSQTLQHIGRKMLRLKASFENGLDSPHDGFVDLIEPAGISVISVSFMRDRQHNAALLSNVLGY
ncbi:hypothetical protein BJV82DRAFT_39730 [Fennellomyces sp. T-0311]|nr:hypothetical protein BJV82DRAFT_39730 [Fennellomyces sp. T-0311]